MVPRSDLQRALSTFLSLNPSVHLLPPTTLTHLTVLYVQVHTCIKHMHLHAMSVHTA